MSNFIPNHVAVFNSLEEGCHGDFIRLLVTVYKPEVYIELGLYSGQTFAKVQSTGIPKKCIGVDINPPNIPGIIVKGTTDVFFNDLTSLYISANENVDMIFIDADHSFKSAKKDFDNSLKILNEGGVILLHDTDPEDNKLFDPGYCGDSYKMVNYIEQERPDLNIITLPVKEAGISIVTRIGETRTHMRMK